MTRLRLALVSASLAAACGVPDSARQTGGGDPQGDDDSAVAADPDAGPPAGPGDVSVLFYSGSELGVEVGSPVVFLDVDGTAEVALTDSDGRASASVSRGASLTAIETVDVGFDNW